MAVVSVIVPVYNAQRYLNTCIRSVLGQTLQDLELILVDDGSTDGSLALCELWAQKDSRVRVIHQQNGGPQSVVVKGVRSACGSFVGFVDSDDWIDPVMYEKLLKAALESHAEVVQCGVELFWEDARPTQSIGKTEQQLLKKEKLWNDVVAGYLDRDRLLDGIDCYRGTKLYRLEVLKSCLDAVPLSLKMREDALLNLNVYAACSAKLELSGSCYYHYLQRPHSVSHLFYDTCFDQVQLYFSELEKLAKRLGLAGASLEARCNEIWADTLQQCISAELPLREKYALLKKTAGLMTQSAPVLKLAQTMPQPLKLLLWLAGKNCFLLTAVCANAGIQLRKLKGKKSHES